MMIFGKVSLMIKATISLLVGGSLALAGPQVVHARGCGGAHASGGYHGGSYSGSHSYSGSSDGRYGGASGSYNRSYEGSHGGSADVSGTRGAAYGPNGAAAGGTRDVSATGPKGQTYNSQQEHGAAAGPNGAAAGGSRSTSATGAYGQSYSGQREGAAAAGPYGAAAGGAYHGAAGYGTAHTALPTDAGYGVAGSGTGAVAYAGYHQTEAVSGSVYAARGAAVRTSYTGYGAFGQGWYAAHPGAWSPTGWTAGRAWGAATWPAVGSWYGWAGGVQPIYYDYGNNVSYQDNQVYYGDQPVASAEQYYQQTATLAQSQPAPDPKTGDWLPLGVFGLVRGSESDPHYVMQVAVNKAGAVAGNYWDVVSGTSVPIQGAVDQKAQRLAWTVGDNKDTVGETGIYNLTKEEAPALIHVGKDKTQQWTLVRLKQPEPAGSEK
jgi:hypothetical protein